MGDGSADLLAVKVPGVPSPAIRQGAPVKVTGLVAQPWTMADRSGRLRARHARRHPQQAAARERTRPAPASLTSWWLGWAEDSAPVHVRLAEVSGIVVAGLAGFGKTMLVAHLLGQLAPRKPCSSSWSMARAAPTTTA
jgi:hypothetical protein